MYKVLVTTYANSSAGAVSVHTSTLEYSSSENAGAREFAIAAAKRINDGNQFTKGLNMLYFQHATLLFQ